MIPITPSGKFWGLLPLFLFYILRIPGSANASLAHNELPKVEVQPYNLNVTVGTDATFTCTVENVSDYNWVAWIRYESRTVISIGMHMMTLIRRFSVAQSGSNIWTLHIKNVQKDDAGGYSCQVNTHPIVSHRGTLHVHVFDPANNINVSSSRHEDVKVSDSSRGVAVHQSNSALVSLAIHLGKVFFPTKISSIICRIIFVSTFFLLF